MYIKNNKTYVYNKYVVNVALIVFGEGFCFEVKNMIAGYSYHIKDEFFERMNDNKLMANKENSHYRPHFLSRH